MPFESLYDVLGISSKATQDEIKDAYRRQAMKWHPDRNPLNKQAAEELFKQIAYAYKVLSDPASRADYDCWLTEQGQGASANAGANERQRQDAGVSEGDAEQMFFEQMLDLAMELASRGFSAEKIVKTLIALDCPEAIAKAVAENSIKAASQHGGGASARAQAETTLQTGIDSIESASWENAVPYYAAVVGGIYADDRLSEDRYFAIKRIRRNRYISLVGGSVILGAVLPVIFDKSADAVALKLFTGAGVGMILGLLAAVISLMFVRDRKEWLREHAMRYYLTAFECYHNARPLPFKFKNWNFWAYFCSVWWISYRRMPGYALLGVVAWAVVVSVMMLIEIDTPELSKFYQPVGYGIAAAVGSVANRIYFRSAQSRIRNALSFSKDQALLRLRNTGGTNGWSWGGFLLLFFALLIPAGAYQSEVHEQRAAAVALQQRAAEEAKQQAQPNAAEEQRVAMIIHEMEIRHPEFDQNHPRYNQKLVDEVLARQKVYIQQGNSPSNALKLAVSDMEREAVPAKNQASQTPSPPVFMTLETFTVNLQSDGNGEHYLQVGIDLKVTDSSVVDLIKLHMPEIRNGVLTLLSSKNAKQIASQEGKQKLIAEIQEEINKPLNAQATGKGVTGVFYTSFVIQ